MEQVSGYVGIRCGVDANGNPYGQYGELFVPAHERFRFMYLGGRILREAPDLTAPRVCSLGEAQPIPQPEPEPGVAHEPQGRECLRAGCSAPVTGRRKVCDSCRTSSKTMT